MTSTAQSSRPIRVRPTTTKQCRTRRPQTFGPTPASAAGDRLHAINIDFSRVAEYYKGDPNGGYRAYVFTDDLSSEKLVALSDWVERDVRERLNIPFNPSAAALRYEHSMGQHGPGSSPDFDPSLVASPGSAPLKFWDRGRLRQAGRGRGPALVVASASRDNRGGDDIGCAAVSGGRATTGGGGVRQRRQPDDVVQIWQGAGSGARSERGRLPPKEARNRVRGPLSAGSRTRSQAVSRDGHGRHARALRGRRGNHELGRRAPRTGWHQ